MMHGEWAEGGEMGKRVVGYGQESGRLWCALQAQASVSAMGVTCRTEQLRLLGTVAACTLHRCFPKSYHLSRLLYSAQRVLVSPKFHALAPGIFSLSSAHDL